MTSVAFVLAAGAHGPMIVNRLDHDPSGSYGVGRDLLEAGWYDSSMVEMLISLLGLRRRYYGDGMAVIDCGANIGTYTVPIAKALSGFGTVLAFEPQERIFYALAGNLALNNIFNTRARFAAVGDHSGTIVVPKLDYCRPGSYGSLSLDPFQTSDVGQPVKHINGQVVDLVMIDSLGFMRLDLFKIDVEGMELDVLDGAAQTIERCKPMIFVEQIKAAGVRDALNARGYLLHDLGMNILAVHKDDSVSSHLHRAEAA